MHSINMPSEMLFLRKCHSTGSALEWLLPEVDFLLMTSQVYLLGEGLAAVNTQKLLSNVHYAVVFQHVELAGEDFATG